ncbi:hypothetical protein GUI43_05518 [Micromonospora noduli]|nr:hypothetical protein GUI43_05518 [Micromonospora noduli]RAO48889.1 hypothetical protein ONO86_02646 [Micromonospora noduli]
MASPNGSASGVTRGLTVVSAPTMSPPVTSNSKASAYVRRTTREPSGARDAPVMAIRPNVLRVFSVWVFGSVISPALRIGTGSVSPLLRAADGV